MCGCCLFVFCLCSGLFSCFQGNLISILLKIPVVDRPCLSTRPALQEKKHIGCYGTAYVLWVCTHVGWSETAHVLWVFTHVWCYGIALLCVRTHVACYAVRLNKLGQRSRTKLGQSALARLTAGQKSMAENSCFLPTFQHVIPWANCQCHRISNICIFQQYPNIDPKNIVFIKPNVNALNNVFEIDDSSTAASQPAALRVATLIRSRNQWYCIVHWNCAASHWFWRSWETTCRLSSIIHYFFGAGSPFHISGFANHNMWTQ